MRRTEAVRAGVSMYERSLRSVEDSTRLLQPAASNRKLGNGRTTWRVGPYKGQPLYSLTLQERDTCPSACPAWTDCYGNNMPFARRIDVRKGGLEKNLELEIRQLSRRHPDGFTVRLHVLGDFFSVDYVLFWERMIRTYPVSVYGYTHRTDQIGDEIDRVYRDNPRRS